MGALLSRGSAAAAEPAAAAARRTVPAAAHKADAAAKAAIAAFPPTPSVPPRPGMPAAELEANRGIIEMLNKTSFSTTEQPAASASTDALAADEEAASTGVPLETLLEALVKHGEDAKRWDAPSLAQKYGISDVSALSDALVHVKPYRIVEDEDGRPRGVAVDAELPSTSKTEDLFAARFDEPPPKPAGIPP